MDSNPSFIYENCLPFIIVVLGYTSDTNLTILWKYLTTLVKFVLSAYTIFLHFRKHIKEKT